MNQANTGNDFATLYISNALDTKIKIRRLDIFPPLIEYIKSKGIEVKTDEFENKRGHKHRKSYIKSRVNSMMNWRITVNMELENYVPRFYLSLSPEFKIKYLHLNKKEIQQIAIDDINYIKENIGSTINLCVGNRDLNFQAISYSPEENINISSWDINFDSKDIPYSNLISNPDMLLQQLLTKKTFKYRIIDTANSNPDDIRKVIELLNKYGEYLNLQYDKSNYMDIAELPNQKDIINIILLCKSGKQYYCDTKEFFLMHNMPFQHIRIRDEFFSNRFSNQMCVVELYKKTHPEDLYLLPDHFLNELIGGFIYLDGNSIYNRLKNTYNKYLAISYIFSRNMDYSDEKISVGRNIDFYSTKYYMNIIDTGKTVDLLMHNETVKKYSNEGRYFNLIVSKEFNKKSMLSIIADLEKNGVNINKIYYVSNFRFRFADNYNYHNSNYSQHPYKIIGKNIAVIKLATNPYLFPQLFSSFVKVLYPLDTEISAVDLKNIVWLCKKRLYRIYSLKNMTQLEPIVIKGKNKEYITNKISDININFLI